MSADLDKAIDRAVREMLDIEPRADLRARVIARIEVPVASVPVASVPVASGFSRKIWFAAPIAAAVMLILAVTIARRSEPPIQRPVEARAGTDQVLPAPQPVTRARIAPAAPTRAARASTPIITGASNDPGDTTIVDPLKAITPLAVAPIGQSRIAPDPIGVPPLNQIAEMQIAPLNPPDGRN